MTVVNTVCSQMLQFVGNTVCTEMLQFAGCLYTAETTTKAYLYVLGLLDLYTTVCTHLQ